MDHFTADEEDEEADVRERQASIDNAAGIAAVEPKPIRARSDDIFGHDPEQAEGSNHFSFIPRPPPLHGRPGSDDLGARLAILRWVSLCSA
jgi:hypothetical protein